MAAGDLLLQNKEHAELLQSYDDRTAAAVQFINAVRPGLNVQTAALRDPKVSAALTLPMLSALSLYMLSLLGTSPVALH